MSFSLPNLGGLLAEVSSANTVESALENAAAVTSQVNVSDAEHPYGFLCLVPPLVAIVIAIISRQVIIPLAIGVLAGAFILCNDGESASHGWTPIFYWDAMVRSIFDTSHLYAFGFSILLAAMVGVLEKCGGMLDLISRLSARIKSRLGAGRMMFAGGLALFFDDYANTLLIGGTMRPVADRYGVSREKLAYIVDSTAAPVAGLALISTWSAVEISYFADGLASANVDSSTESLMMFLRSIPYRFYCWFALVMVGAVVIFGRDFGPMQVAESKTLENHTDDEADQSPGTKTSRPENVDRTENVDRPETRQPLPSDGQFLTLDSNPWRPLNSQESSPNRPERQFGSPSQRFPLWTAAIFPVVACLVAVVLLLIQSGNATVAADIADGAEIDLAKMAWWLRWITIIGNGDSFFALFIGGAVGLLVAGIMHIAAGASDFTKTVWAALWGAAQMIPAMAILWFAWAMAEITNADYLKTGDYLSGMISQSLDPRLLPSVVFLVAGFVAFSTGTSWGTMGILTPLSVEMALQMDPAGTTQGAVTLATAGAVLAGAIFGDHCSPLSDTTVLSSRSSGCNHVAHVRTQMPYAILVAIVSVLFGSLPSAIGISPWICLVLGSLVIVLVVRFVGRLPSRIAPTG